MPLIDGDTVDTAALAHARMAAPIARGCIRVANDDFRVDEDCPVVLSGAGEHLWCRIQKDGLTTADAAQRLSRAAGVHPRHIGFAGQKDRHAVTTQWFSLAWPIKVDAPELPDEPALRVLDIARHDRKLKRGAHRGNRFTLRVRDVDGSRPELDADLARIARDGVPNYFGPQRFGQAGRNIELARALFAGKRLSRDRRGFALSAARSLLFNAVLHARVIDGSWNRLIDGDAVMLDGSHSLFARNSSGQTAAELDARSAAFDIHPSGPLPGREIDPVVEGEAGQLEQRVLAEFADLQEGLVQCGVDAARRALRLPVHDLEHAWEDSTLVLSFWLPTGAFATSVLREVVQVSEPARNAP